MGAQKFKFAGIVDTSNLGFKCLYFEMLSAPTKLDNSKEVHVYFYLITAMRVYRKIVDSALQIFYRPFNGVGIFTGVQLIDELYASSYHFVCKLSNLQNFEAFPTADCKWKTQQK